MMWITGSKDQVHRMTVIIFLDDQNRWIALLVQGIFAIKEQIMFVCEAKNLLRGVMCPHCQHDTCVALGADPFSRFNALDLNNHCSTKECKAFYHELNNQFMSYEDGNISYLEFQEWLDNFKGDHA